MLSLEKFKLDFKLEQKDYPNINLESLKISGLINDMALKIGCNWARKGNSLLEINFNIEKAIAFKNARPAFLGFNGYKYASCLSVNDITVHSPPNDYRLEDGDVLKIDVGTIYNDWYTDAATTIIIGPTSKYKDRISLVEKSRDLIKTISKTPLYGLNLWQVAQIIENDAKSMKLNLIPDLGGHRIGKGFLHGAPFISNVMPKNPEEAQKLRDYTLKDGDIICIEPVTTFGYPAVYIDPEDGWTCRTLDKSITAHFEKTLLITPKGNEVISG